MDSNHVTNCHSPKSRGGPGLESPTHTPPTAYIWCQRGGIKMDKTSEDSSVQLDTRKEFWKRITDTFLFLKSREPQILEPQILKPQILEPQTHGQYGLPN